jgi:hypothetical protein
MISLWPEPNVWMTSPRATEAPRMGASFAIVAAFFSRAVASISLARA